jgi:uncharacterized protein (TIGR03435 family)
MTHRHGIVLFVLTLAVAGLPAQAPPTFEAISIRESMGTRLALQWQGPRLVGGELPLSTLLAVAYQIPLYQLAELPEWVRTTRYEINALATRVPTQAEQMAFLRVLLEERFKIVARKATQERPIYALVLARADGRLASGLRPTANDCFAIMSARAGAPAPPGGPQCRVTMSAGAYIRDGVPMALLADLVSTRLQRPVVDRTGLTGNYDIDLHFRPTASAAATAPAAADEPDFLTALEEQLGLKAESTRAPVELTVIDRVERPTLD